MCQLNVFMVKKSIDSNDVKNCFDDSVCFEDISDEFEGLGFDDYFFYHNSGMRCNCGSVVCKLQDCEESYLGFLEKIRRDKLDEYLKVKEILSNENFDQKYQEVRENYEKIKNQEDKIKYFQDNLVYFQMTVHEIRAGAEGFDNVEKYINNEIYLYENNLKPNYDMQEFEGIKEDLQKIVDVAKEVKFFAFWQGEDFVLKDAKTVKIQDLKIEDIVYLKYGEILTVEM